MDWWFVLLLGIGLLLLLMILGMPIFVAFLILNVAGVYWLLGPAGFGMFANSMYATATLTELAAVPLFILMGELLFRSGAMERLLTSLDRLVGQIRGRQYILCILLSAICGALAGAAMAVAGLLGRSLYPTMAKRGYDRKLSAGTILGGATVDAIIPPSVLAIIVASLAKVSTGSLLVAGIIPGLFLLGMSTIYVLVRVRYNPSLAPDLSEDLRDPNTRGSAFIAFLRLLPVMSIFLVVMGFIMLGIATPTEAAACGVLCALVLSGFYGGLNWQMLHQSLTSGVRVAGIMLAIMACAAMFNQLLIFSGALSQLTTFVLELNPAYYVMLALMLALPFFLFMFLDQVSVLMVLVPLYLPIIDLYEFDPIWFWALILVIATAGGITPPLGYTLYAFKSAVPHFDTRELFQAALPFVGLIVMGIVIMIIFPGIITYLPNLMR
ncbi:MAG: TRAP-type mannitol/chloroaromatic compound transport system, large permease component [Rhodobacteraceae bacterium HLUCCA12]|nr:MAG: TRAP-type mannitol/chloroaromatic compound transport system, large permease component [Rhodobacteraceae bacterium HLUCCA12]